MKLKISAEIDGDVYEYFRLVRKEIEDKFNDVFLQTEYGIPSFFLIAIIRSPSAVIKFPEVFKYNAKENDCEYRVSINHNSFLHASHEERLSLICDALEKAINHLINQKPEAIDVNQLYHDFHNVRKKEQF